MVISDPNFDPEKELCDFCYFFYGSFSSYLNNRNLEPFNAIDICRWLSKNMDFQ